VRFEFRLRLVLEKSQAVADNRAIILLGQSLAILLSVRWVTDKAIEVLYR